MNYFHPIGYAATLLFLTGCTVNPPMPTETQSSPANPAISAASATAPSPKAETDIALDTTILPGDRVGPITTTTSYQDLVDQFGEEALTDAEVHVGEGFFEPGTQVDLGEGRSLTILWSDEDRTQPAEVRELGAAWKTPEGIGIGTSFAELQNILGTFQLSGFGWDYGGTIDLHDTPLESYDYDLVVRVQPAIGMVESSREHFEAVLGDEMFSSDHPSFSELDITVSEMIVYLMPAE